MVIYFLILGILSSLWGMSLLRGHPHKTNWPLQKFTTWILYLLRSYVRLAPILLTRSFRLTVIALSTPSVKMKTRARNWYHLMTPARLMCKKRASMKWLWLCNTTKNVPTVRELFGNLYDSGLYLWPGKVRNFSNLYIFPPHNAEFLHHFKDFPQ